MTDKQDFVVAKRDARTGHIDIPITPTSDSHAVSKDYVDTNINGITFNTSNTEVVFNDGGSLRGSDRLTFINGSGRFQAGRFNTNSGGNGSALFGQQCSINGNYSFCGGFSSAARATNTFAWGSSNTCDGENSVTIGGFNNSVSSGATMNLVTGSSDVCSGDRNIISGTSNNVSGNYNAVSGLENDVNGDYNVVGGIQNIVDGGRSGIFGRENESECANSIITGYRNVETTGGDGHNMICGLENDLGASAGRAIVGGRGNTVNSTNLICTGFNNTTTGGGSITVGENNNNSGVNSICTGDSNSCTSENGVCLGQQNSCTGFQSITIGRQASTANGNYGLALGRQAATTASECIAIGKISAGSSLGANVAIGACSSSNTRFSTSGTERVHIYARNEGNYDDGIQVISGDAASTKLLTSKEHGSVLTWSYTPTTSGDWITAPDNIGDALDALAAGGASVGTAANLTFTGPWASNQTGSYEARRSGAMVSLRLLTFSAPANSTSAVLTSTTGIAAGFRPSTLIEKLIRITDNGNPAVGTLQIASTGVLTVRTLANGSLNQALGTNTTGVATEITVNYDINF